MNRPTISPRRGEIWTVDFNPTRGAEIQKVRPAVVISSDDIGKLPLKLVAPITGWQPAFEQNLWHVKLLPSTKNGLDKTSAVDALQIRSVAVERFVKYLGHVSEEELEDVVHALAVVVEISKIL